MDYLTEMVEEIKPILKSYGYKKSALNWIKENDSNNTVQIFNIQKSQFGKQIYLNVGIIFKKSYKDKNYVIYKSKLQARLDGLLAKGILDFENDINKEIRFNEIKQLFIIDQYNFFKMNCNKEELVNYVTKAYHNMENVLNNGLKIIEENA
jgi:DNA-directed RNA polymerase subunit H (RpoH/RPB5)